MRSRFTGRRHAVVAAIAVLALGAFTATAAAVLTGSAGGAQFRMDNRGETNTQATNAVGWVDVVGSDIPIAVPDAGRLINARFTAETNCFGMAGTFCRARIIAINVANGAITELDPASGLDFALDSVNDGPNTSWEGNAMERSRRLPMGQYRLRTQISVSNAATTFQVDDWHFAVEQSV